MREALFVTVWLRRQEQKVRESALFASGVADLIVRKDSSNTIKAYKELVDAFFPFAAKERTKTDQELIDRMKKEADKGPIIFSIPQTQSPLQKAASKMRLPDEFRQKLQQRVRRKA